MSYNETLAARVRKTIAGQKELEEKRMFGGLTFMVNGNMCCGVLNDDLVVRIGLDRYRKALARPHARPMDFTGRPLKGMLYIGPEGCKTDQALKSWVDQAVSFALLLPTGGSEKRALRKSRKR